MAMTMMMVHQPSSMTPQPAFLVAQRQFFQRRRRTRILKATRSFAKTLFSLALITFCFDRNNNILQFSQRRCSSRCGSSDNGGRVINFVSAWETCPPKHKGDKSVDVCPDGNTCCKIFADRGAANGVSTTSTQLPFLQSPPPSSSYGCVPSDMGRYNATCCDIEEDGGGGIDTGCPVGYTCELLMSTSPTTTNGNDDQFHITAFDNDDYNDKIPVCIAPEYHQDPLTLVLPRYHLCQIPSGNKFDGRTVYGLPIKAKNATTTAATTKTATAELAYYSSHGPIEEINVSSETTINKVLIVVHGANRNGDDYFCSGLSTIHLYQRRQQKRGRGDATRDNVLVVAPIFYGNTDRDKIPSDKSFLYWDVQSDSDGPWRYGADAMGPVPHISSFEALDALIMAIQTYVFEEKQFKKKRPTNQNKRNMITIAGHSSGGQMVQRWTLLTASTIWPLLDRVDPTRNFRIRAVVANPSSYVYLSPLRLIDGQWKEPSTATKKQCPLYNQWEWGLDDGGPYDVPYKRRALHPQGNNAFTSYNSNASNNKNILKDVIDRYKRHREVVYLIGDRDRCNVSSSSASSIHNKWCNSHGLETTCMDEIQGTNRFERNERFMMSLSLSMSLDGDAELDKTEKHRHRRIIVPNVGHDHTMIFQSRQGLDALYDDDSDEQLTDDEGDGDDNATIISSE